MDFFCFFILFKFHHQHHGINSKKFYDDFYLPKHLEYSNHYEKIITTQFRKQSTANYFNTGLITSFGAP